MKRLSWRQDDNNNENGRANKGLIIKSSVAMRKKRVVCACRHAACRPPHLPSPALPDLAATHTPTSTAFTRTPAPSATLPPPHTPHTHTHVHTRYALRRARAHLWVPARLCAVRCQPYIPSGGSGWTPPRLPAAVCRHAFTSCCWVHTCTRGLPVPRSSAPTYCYAPRAPHAMRRRIHAILTLCTSPQ